jgi:hypothetical protein
MPKEVKVIGFSGSPKSLDASYWKRTMTANAAWENSNVALLTVDGTLNCDTSIDMVILEAGKYVKLKFSPASGDTNGQGITIPSGFEEVKVTAVSGTVEKLDSKFIDYAKKKTSAYGDPNAETAVVNDVLYPGDMIVCSTGGYFELMFTAFGREEAFGPYVGLPACHAFLADY